jgi:hypothetical protein
MSRENEVRFVNVALAHSTTFQLICYRHSSDFRKCPIIHTVCIMGTEQHHASAGPLKPYEETTQKGNNISPRISRLTSSYNMSPKSIC